MAVKADSAGAEIGGFASCFLPGRGKTNSVGLDVMMRRCRMV